MIEKNKEEKYIEQKKGTNRKPKPPVELFRVLDIPKGEFDMPTLKSKNRYIPYSSANHRGKRYIYIEGDTDDEKYIGDITSSDITSSSESEYEEMDLHVPSGPPKYKTLIEVVLEPSKRDIQNDLPSDDTPRNESMNDEEWNELKENFISQYLQNELKDMPNNLPDNSDNNTHPNTLYDNVDEKPFIMSIHDRNLYTGEEYNYDMLNSGIYGGSSNSDSLSGNNDPISDNHAPYSGIDLINDSLSGNHDIYDEILKRKENELFGTENKKHTTHNSFAKHTNTDPLMNQIDLFHKWLDRHRDMCQQWENNHERLDRLKEEWEKDTNSGNINPSGDNIPSDNIPSDIPNGELSDISNGKLSDTSTGKLSDTPNHNNKHSDIPYALNTDVSIQIDMDKPYQMENMNPVDQNPLLVENINLVDSNTLNPTLPYNPNLVENNTPIPNPTKVQIELSVKNSKMEEKENFPIGDVWGI
nr:erythrocyte membrane protein 1, PfEMP1, putative [Plasmodium sp. DRC-Itaito]